VQCAQPFDAVVGRFILQFLPDPLSVARRLGQVVRPGGIIAFQEVSYTPFLALSARLPLWSALDGEPGLLGSDPGFTRWIYDLLCSLRPQIHEHGACLEPLGDFNTLPQRLQVEVATAHTVVPFVALVGAWSRRPSV